ncbi:hypothetical protein ACFVUH_25170 [Kitasatospora sp. NPDC058032]|uniref:hypothetical protein n=1 Tax=Kitasatospora sp. NPDC058032 TaxID=3346307 RepID=UPI0036DE0D01
MSNWRDGGDESGDVFLGGGPTVEGVDYEAAWLEARAAAVHLNSVLAALGLQGDDQVKAQAGWSDDGHGVVFLRGTLSGARKLGATLDRMATRDGAVDDADPNPEASAGS